jgi:hypothetical protein
MKEIQDLWDKGFKNSLLGQNVVTCGMAAVEKRFHNCFKKKQRL